MKRQFLKPSALGVVLMLCLLTVQSSMLQGMSQSVDLTGTRTHYTYGVPTMLRITDSISDNNFTRAHSVHVYWNTIAIVLVVAWCLSMPIGRWISGYLRRDGSYAGPPYTGIRQPAAIIGFVLAGWLLLSVICAVALRPLFPSGAGTFGDFVFGFYMLLMVLTIPIAVIVMIVRRWRYRSRVGQRGFAVEMPAASAAQV